MDNIMLVPPFLNAPLNDVNDDKPLVEFSLRMNTKLNFLENDKFDQNVMVYDENYGATENNYGENGDNIMKNNFRLCDEGASIKLSIYKSLLHIKRGEYICIYLAFLNVTA